VGVVLALFVLPRAGTQTATPRVGTAAPTAVAGQGPPAGTPAGGTAPQSSGLALRTVLDERFASNQRNWPNNPQSTAWFADGAYRLYARRPGDFVAIGVPGIGPLRDVAVTATFRKVGGPPGGGYGIIVRDQGPGPRDGVNQLGRFYIFEVGDRGEFGIWRRDGDRWIDIVPWTRSEAVRPGGEPNQLEVLAFGSQLAFTVNGTRVATQTDATLTEGTVGIFVGGDLNEVVIERLHIIAPS
jgi:hypothetical protein